MVIIKAANYIENLISNADQTRDIHSLINQSDDHRIYTNFFSLIFFFYLQISSTCPVCVTYEVRSKFVITSLRPAFAKIYPSTRPDLAVETFFHARPGSPLLRGITDDDFITWFDKTELASLKTSTSIDNICECGRICSRDYEFRKNYEEHTETTTENVDTTTEESSTITTTEPSTTEEVTSTESSTSTSTTEIVTTQDPTTTTDKTTTDNLSTIKIESIDDPIIIPTVTYVNTTEKQDVNNDLASLLPKITGELIVPKSVLPRKEDFKKKPLPRRKGTLKATYGDKHEKFFLKLREMENSVSTTTTTTITTPAVTSPSTTTMTTAITSTEVPQEITSNEKETTAVPITIETEKSLHKIVLKKPDHPKPLIPVNVVANKTELKTKLFKINAEENMTKVNKTVTVEIPTTELPITHNDITTVKPIKTVIPHTITAITNNNIKSIHYRTKKPKPITQIKKPVINNVHNITKQNKSEDIDSDIINKTKKKTIVPQKYNAKTMKSINKEIHKIPPTPISETSKTLSETLKYDIAPENKGGFEILDKNNLWELLKEGSDNDPSKLEEKLHVHNRLNILGHNASNIDDNRSL